MRHRWIHTNYASAKVGLMVCTCCNKPITEGDFRYRITEEAYLSQHRACSADDPQWAVEDAEKKACADKEARRRAAYAAFVAEFGEPHDLYDDGRY